MQAWLTPPTRIIFLRGRSIKKGRSSNRDQRTVRDVHHDDRLWTLYSSHGTLESGSEPNTILGDGGLPINIIAFHWSLFEFINIAWPRPYAVSLDTPLVATLGCAAGPGKYCECDRPARFVQHHSETHTARIIFVMPTTSVVQVLSSTRNHRFLSATASLTQKFMHGTVHVLSQPHGCFPRFFPALTPSTVTPRLIEIESRSLSASLSHPRS